MIGLAPLWIACTVTPPPPVVDAVVPDKGYYGYATDVEIDGDKFYPSVVIDGQQEDGGRLEGTFEAWLLTTPPTPLRAVYQVAYDQLRAEVPAGLDPGTYGMRVRTPSGQEDTLEDAFTVTSTLADHLRVDVDAAGYEVGDLATLRIRLEDPQDNPVAQALDVKVTASSGTGARGVTFNMNGLGDQTPLGGGAVGVSGSLGAGGEGEVLLTSSVPDDVTIKVEPLDDPAVDPPDPLVLTWTPGAIADVEVDLPHDDFQTVAGDPFDVDITLKDALGNELDLDSASVLLYDECGDLRQTVTVVGRATVEVSVERACTQDHIVAYVDGVEWKSAPFVVMPDEAAGYAVETLSASVVAGDDLIVIVSAVDAYGNTVSGYSGLVTLRDDLGGLDPARDVGYAYCPGFDPGGPARQLCTVRLWVAGDDVVVSADDPAGLRGSAAPIEVIPADPVAVVVSSPISSTVAGDAFDVGVRVVDAYGNGVSFDPGGTDPVTFTDDTDSIACVWTGLVSGTQTFSCTVEGVDDADDVTAGVLGLQGIVAHAIEVVNAGLADVEISPDGTAFTAGEPFTVALRGFDRFGNAYRVQSDPVVDLTDQSGTLSPATARLDGDGEATVAATITRAGETTIAAWQGGTLLGTSDPLVLDPATMTAFLVTVPPWVDIDATGTVSIAPVDAWGNVVQDFAGPATLTSSTGACDPQTLSGFDGGALDVDVTCATPALGETFTVTSASGLSGESAAFDAVDFGCADGPVADLAIDGASDGVACLVAGAASLDFDASASTSGGSPIALVHFLDGDAIDTRGGDTVVTATYSTSGAWPVEALVADTRGCADLATGTAWVGEGSEPTGPITVTAGSATVPTGRTTTVVLAARDCSGDVAAGKSLLVRADLGTLSAGATGSGLGVTLDAAGQASLSWTFDAAFSATGTVAAGTSSGSAYGADTVDVTQDHARPHVVSMTPLGRTTSVVDAITVTFDEPMLATNLVATNFVLTGPDGIVSATLDAADDYRSVTLTPSGTVDGSVGTWTLQVSSNVRDAAGNRLDGTWSGSGSTFTGTFGAVTDTAPAVTSCDADLATFTPDGDSGAGVEADTVAFAPVASAVPTWWILTVTDADGERVFGTRLAGTDPDVPWDGRGDDGVVVASGTYTASVAAMDANGNESAACAASVGVTQHVEAP